MPSIHDRDVTARQALDARKDYLAWRDNTPAQGNRQRVAKLDKQDASHESKPLSKSRRRWLRKQAKRQMARQAEYRAMRIAYAETLPDELQDIAQRITQPISRDGTDYRKARLQSKRRPL